MNRYRFFTAINWVVALLLIFSACTNDEPMDLNALPEGKYPLKIASVTMSVESSSKPWGVNAPQTRVTESDTDGKSSVWEWNGTEQIGVQIDDGKTGTYVLNEGKTITAENACYWASTATGQTVKAWFLNTYEPISLADQSKGLAYVLQATETVDFDKTVTLGFTHQLAKVRVVLDGTQAAQAKTVEVRGYTSCTHTAGAVSTEGAEQGWLKMKRTTYADGTECWEANVVPGKIALSNFIRLNGMTVVSNLSGIPETLDAAKMYTIDLTVGKPLTEITVENCDNISDDGNYRVSGNFEHTITITGGSPHIYLEDAQISVSDGPAIDIMGGASPTIHVRGESTIETSESLSNRSAGIYVAEGSSVTIEGSGTDGAAIGGYYNSSDKSCGNIEIKNVALHAYAVNKCFPHGIVGRGLFLTHSVFYHERTGSDCIRRLYTLT